MRSELVQTTSRKKAIEATPWASVWKKVEGGYRAFESQADYNTWRNQK